MSSLQVSPFLLSGSYLECIVVACGTKPVRYIQAMVPSNSSGYRRSGPEIYEKIRNDAIVRWMKLKVTSHPAYAPYMESKTRPQRIAEVIRQYGLVSEMLRRFAGETVTDDCYGPDVSGLKVTPVRFTFTSTQIYF